MGNRFSLFLDDVSEFLARRKGLLPLIGLLFIVINFVLQFFPVGWVSSSNLFLHLGVIIVVIGFLVGWAL